MFCTSSLTDTTDPLKAAMMNRRVLLHDDNALTPTTGGYFKHTLPKALSTIVTTRNPALKKCHHWNACGQEVAARDTATQEEKGKNKKVTKQTQLFIIHSTRSKLNVIQLWLTLTLKY